MGTILPNSNPVLVRDFTGLGVQNWTVLKCSERPEYLLLDFVSTRTWTVLPTKFFSEFLDCFLSCSLRESQRFFLV